MQYWKLSFGEVNCLYGRKLHCTAYKTLKFMKNLELLHFMPPICSWYCSLHTRKNCCIHPKIWTVCFYPRAVRSKDGDGIINSVYQTAAVWSGSVRFAKKRRIINLLHSEVSYIIDITCRWTISSNITSFSYFFGTPKPRFFFHFPTPNFCRTILSNLR